MMRAVEERQLHAISNFSSDEDALLFSNETLSVETGIRRSMP